MRLDKISPLALEKAKGKRSKLMCGIVKLLDKQTIDLTSIVLGGIGAYKIFIDYNPPQLHSTFFGSNPYSIKKEHLEKYPNKIFNWLPILALFLQALRAVFSDQIQERIYTTAAYEIYFISLSLIGGMSLFIAAQIGRRVAKKRIIQLQREAFFSAVEIIENNGWRNDQLEVKDKIADPDRYKKANWESANERLNQIEELLEIDSKGENLRDRADALSKFFQN